MVNSLYHYCSLETFLKIVESKEIWLTNIFSMNDSAELRWLLDVAKRILDRQPDMPDERRTFLESELSRRKEETDLYCFCMSEHGDLLSQWRAYADDGRGVAIGLSRQYLLAAEREYENSGLQLECVEYRLPEQEKLVQRRIEEVLQDAPAPAGSSPTELTRDLPEQIALSRIWSDAARCKNPFFHEEKEVRLIYEARSVCRPNLGQRKYRAHEGELIPYHVLSLFREYEYPPIYDIALGPKCIGEYNESRVKQVLSDNGYNVEYLDVWRSEGTLQ